VSESKTEILNQPAKVTSIPTNSTPVTNTAPTPTTQTSNPTPATLEIRTVTAFITEVSGDIVALDYISIHKGDTALPQMIRDGLCTEYDKHKCNLDDGVYYQNNDPTIHWFTLFPTAEFQTWTGGEEYLSNIKRTSPSNTPYKVTLNEHNQITNIKEIYKK
jgi:hypothetical protein